MQEYIFENGLIVGRFQHIHLGHEKLIKIGLKLCNKVLIFIGSATEETSLENPYPFEYRKKLIEEIFEEEVKTGKLIIAPLKDLEDKAVMTQEWGEYVLKNATNILYEKPSCIIYGKDKNIFKCFTKDIVDNISEVFVDRKELLVSATVMREFLLKDNKEEWMKFANSKIHYRYDELREKLDKSIL